MAPQPGVEEASPSPPDPTLPIDQPIASLGDDHGEGSDSSDGGRVDGDQGEEWDPAAERLPNAASGSKSKGKAKAHDSGPGQTGDTAQAQPWQAVWSAEQNAWYFWNTESGAVTWTNPLEPPAESSSPKPHLANSTPTHPIQPPLPLGPPPTSQRPADTPPTFGIPADIDPDLAYLLPPSQRGSATAAPGAQTALFNARTGRFTPVDYAYSVDHLDEYNRAKRMNSHYFDVDAWERQKAEENAKRKREEESGVVKKDKITRKDMERFRKKAVEKKHRSRAWLRD